MFSTRKRKARKKWNNTNNNSYDNLNANANLYKARVKLAKKIVRTTAGALTCTFLAVYALNVAQTYPKFRNLPWVKQALEKAPEALLAPDPNDKERFAKRFFRAHKATFKYIKAPFISTIKQLLPENLPGIPVTMSQLQIMLDMSGNTNNINLFTNPTLSGVSDARKWKKGYNSMPKPDIDLGFGKIALSIPKLPHIDIQTMFSDMILEGTLAWSVYATSKSYAFWEWVPEWVGVSMHLILALNTAQVVYWK